MTTIGSDVEVTRLQCAYDRAELACDDAASAERAAFRCWEEAMGAYEVARDESAQAWRAYAAAVG
ncbi:MAG TPA: hypothetical protein VMU51_38030 [Mycobacteriales bacterium]|nr:hypothetical protein [Mycobacteriales bacterium]